MLQHVSRMPDNIDMTDNEPTSDHTQYDGGPASNSEQAYGGAAPAQPPTPPQPPETNQPQEAQRSPYARPLPETPQSEPPYQPRPAYQQPGYQAQPPYQPQPTYQQPGYAPPPYGPPQLADPGATGYGQPAAAPSGPIYGQPGQSGYQDPPAAGGGFYAGGYPGAANYPGPVQQGDVLLAGPPRRSRNTAPIVVSVVAVLVIILGAGGFTAFKLLAASGSQPDKWAPANSLFYAKIDLDPSASAKVAAWEFEKKFPDAPKIASADDLKDGLLRAIFTDDTGADVNYDTDIKPWLGDRAAIDVFLDSSGQPQPIGILAVKDAGKATAGLQKIAANSSDGGSAFVVKGSFAIVGDSQEAVDEAVKAASDANITRNDNYKADIDKLKDDRIVTAWWDLGATFKAVGKQASMLLPASGTMGLAALANARIVMGLRVQPDYVEVQGYGVGEPAALASSGNAGQALGDLPTGTVAGLSIANPEKLVKNQLTSLQGGLLGAGLQNELDTLGAQLGISLPGDLENLLGSELTVGVTSQSGGFLSGGMLRLITRPDDAAAGLGTAQKLAGILSQQSGETFTASAQGPRVVITNDSQPASGKLGDSDSFKKALAGMPSSTSAAGYVDLTQIIAATGPRPRDLAPLDSIGFYDARSGDAERFSIRLTVK